MILLFINSLLASPTEQWATVYEDIANTNAMLNATAYATIAHQRSIESQYKWDDLEVSGYYLTSPTNPNAYTELEFTQHLPSVWNVSTQNTLLEQHHMLNEIRQDTLKVELFHQVTVKLIELVHINKRIVQESARVARANTHLEHYRALEKAGEVSPSAMQKVQLVALEHTLSLQQLSTQQNQLREEIALLKGSPLEESPTQYPYAIEDIQKDEIWREVLQQNLDLKIINQQVQLANTTLQLEKRSVLPSLAVGGNTQGNQMERYSGVYLGMTIPMYKSSKNIEHAQYQHKYQQEMLQYHRQKAEMTLTQHCDAYTSLKSQLEQIQSILNVVDYQGHLEQQLLSGTLSFSEYNRESAFYLHAEDQILDITHQLQTLLAHIYRHRLLESS